MLYDSSIYEPIVPIAYGGGEDKTGEDGVRREFWPSERWKGGIRTGPKTTEEGKITIGDWVVFEDVCGEYHEEVFRDGKGPWRLPEAH
jgi:signal peptidase I